jgi:hypothetical protein
MSKMLFALIVSVGLCGSVDSSSAQRPASASAPLIGTWTLTSAERLDVGSGRSTIPAPRGMLVFDAAGHALEVITRGNRQVYAANQPTPAEAQTTFASYAGFWGSYRTDEQQGRIIYRPEGAVNPDGAPCYPRPIARRASSPTRRRVMSACTSCRSAANPLRVTRRQTRRPAPPLPDTSVTTVSIPFTPEWCFIIVSRCSVPGRSATRSTGPTRFQKVSDKEDDEERRASFDRLTVTV